MSTWDAARLAAWSASHLRNVETALSRWVGVDAPVLLGDAMRYAVLDGGKRLRPLLVLAAWEAVTRESGGLSGTPAADAPIRTYMVQQVVTMRKTANAKAAVVRSLPVGATVYPTGNKQDVWWEIADENDNVGWVLNTKLAPSR